MLHEQFGGMITTHIRNKSRPNSRETIRWTIRAKEAIIFLKLILPYLIIKRGQALIVIKYQQIKLSLDKNSHLDFKEMMHIMNKTGTS